jgi:hypothetical protein
MMRGLPLLIALAGAQDTAFVFVGHARTFSEPAVHSSIKTNLIDVIGGDVFWYLSEKPGWDAATETILRDLFQPVAVEVVTSSEEGEWHDEASIKWHGNCSRPPLPDLDGLGVPPTFKFYKDPARAVDVARNVYAKWSKAWEMVLREEAKRGAPYEWVARCRFDAAWYAPLQLPKEIGVVYAPIQTWNAVNDQFALCHRSVAQQYFSSASILDTCAPNGEPRWYSTIEHGMAPTCLNEHTCSPGSVVGDPIVWQPETFLWRHLVLENVTLRRTTIPAVISRDDGLSRCTELMPYVLLTTLLDIVALEFGASSSSRRTPRVLKTAHVAACAATVPMSIDVFSSPSSNEERSRRERLSALVTSDNIREELTFLLERYNILKEADPDGVVVAQINGNTHAIPTSADEAVAMSATYSRFAVLGAEAAATYASIICDYLQRWPRARAVAHVEGLALDLNCAAAPSHLQTTEAALHAMLDDLRLTNPTYSTVSADVLGWQVWAVSHASTFRRLPETPFSSMYRVPV